jgi:fatty acid desaturase
MARGRTHPDGMMWETYEQGLDNLLGRFWSLLTLTPYAQWLRHHVKHHGAWNDLDRRNAHGRDIYSSCLTVAEYNALGTRRRLLHRTAKHPAISLLVLPPRFGARISPYRCVRSQVAYYMTRTVTGIPSDVI